MPWNKTSEELQSEIVHFLGISFDSRYKDVAKLYRVSEWLVSELARKYLSEEVLALRYSIINRNAKMGDKNPMKGCTRLKHHNAKDTVLVCGYLTEWAPDWWTGHMPKGNRVYVHQRVWCEANKKTKVPAKHVIHHKDENKLNNSVDNLVCMTRKEHAQLHCVNNILKGATTIPGREVESSALEAQRVLETGL